jgi:hypothetical protein
VACPSEEHWNAVKQVLDVSKGLRDSGCGWSRTLVVGFSDADFAGDVDAHKSTTAYVFKVGVGHVLWRSVLQPTVALSTIAMKAEYMAAAAASQEALWLCRLLRSRS